ncbi:thioesterase family protein [Pelagicoccus sp. SDUM812005]|uniref:acyl-CoA thioesterase n=1 Tax=Pelagicoccus sp. SDUM812005 TaxID=3041257 RepID=UPI00280CB3E4|nr:thioesterase family protein [Pelagicoccus sp. SDUM812005]MDQ8182977.1 thioesterase family protein [Pelagicoccus sp. SDUM812005]
MLESVTTIQVRYAETDMMGIVYHANYLPWLEIGRTELLRENGLPYKEIEARGLMLPVLDVSVQYKRPAKYDDTVTIHTRIAEKPFLKIKIAYQLTRDGELLATASTTHAFMTPDGRPTKPPAFFREALDKKFTP